MRRHAISSVQRLVGWVSQSTQVGSLEVTHQSYECLQAPACLRTFAAVRKKKPTQQQPSSSSSSSPPSQQDMEPPPPPPPGMFTVVSSMIAGAGGAVLVAGIGCLAVFQMALSVSEHAGKIQKQHPTLSESVED